MRPLKPKWQTWLVAAFVAVILTWANSLVRHPSPIRVGVGLTLYEVGWPCVMVRGYVSGVSRQIVFFDEKWVFPGYAANAAVAVLVVLSASAACESCLRIIRK